jgi:hypothetical protein
VAAASQVIGVRALLIHCENDSAPYLNLRLAKFDASTTDPAHLFLLMKILRKSTEERLTVAPPTGWPDLVWHQPAP